MPVPASATTLPTSSAAKSGANARTRWPTVMSSSASTMLPSRPMLRATRGAMTPDAASRIGGSVPITPTPMFDMGMSTRMSLRIGDIAATAIRRVNATSTMPASAAARPAHTGRWWFSDIAEPRMSLDEPKDMAGDLPQSRYETAPRDTIDQDVPPAGGDASRGTSAPSSRMTATQMAAHIAHELVHHRLLLQ